jgi:hypothetical protein
MKFLESLRAQGALFAFLASQCKATETPIFADLCWGKQRDFTKIVSDPGIEFDKGSRLFVLMRIEGEVRYYAGTSDPSDAESESEVGVFPDISSALAFGYDYLIRRCHFLEINTARNTRK